MVLGSRRLRAIVVLPILSYGFSIFFGQGILLTGGKVRYWEYALFLCVVIVAVLRTRVVLRKGECIEILSFGRRQSILAKEYLLHAEIHSSGRYSSVQWNLECQKDPRRSLGMGFISLGPRRTMNTASRALDLRTTFETEVMLDAIARARDAGPSRGLFVIVITGVAIAIGIGIMVARGVISSGGPKGQLKIQCAGDQNVRVGGGYGTANGKIWVHMRPDRYNVDLWIPQRGCWARSSVTIVAGETLSLRCEDLQGARECVPGDAPLIYRPGSKSH